MSENSLLVTAYSHWTRSNRVGRFTVLTSGFAETSISTGPNIRQCAVESEYDYETDSDLDEFDMHDDPSTPIASPSSSSNSSSYTIINGKSKEEPAGSSTSGKIRESTAAPRCHQIFIPNMAYRTCV